MAVIKPFQAYRPKKGLEKKIAALPYDVYDREEALAEVTKEPLSFLKIDRAETNFPKTVDTYDSCVYEKAAELLNEMIKQEYFMQDHTECYYLYEQIMDGRSQTGIVACASIEDYCNQVIKKHENTRADKEEDRIRHVDACSAQTGPIFLAYRSSEKIDQLTAEIKKKRRNMTLFQKMVLHIKYGSFPILKKQKQLQMHLPLWTVFILQTDITDAPLQ